jgi:hypothetical protein
MSQVHLHIFLYVNLLNAYLTTAIKQLLHEVILIHLTPYMSVSLACKYVP